MCLPSRKVVVIEDDIIQSTIFSEIFKKEGIEGICLDNPHTAVDKIVKEQPDLILLDINIPYAGKTNEGIGYDILNELKCHSKTRDIPVVIVSSNDNLVDQIKCLYRGCLDFLQKPLGVDYLTTKIKAYSRLGSICKLNKASK